MLQKYDECIGRRYTSAGEVTTRDQAQGKIQHAGRAGPSGPIYARDELEAGTIHA